MWEKGRKEIKMKKGRSERERERKEVKGTLQTESDNVGPVFIICDDKICQFQSRSDPEAI
jgi:hypothetical protein